MCIGSYFAISRGNMAEALADLTGGNYFTTYDNHFTTYDNFITTYDNYFTTYDN